MGKYITRTDLENALNPGTVLALFDDANDGAGNSAAINSVIDDAEAMIDSYLQTVYRGVPLTASTDRLIKKAAKDFAVAYALERHPEYIAGYGEARRAERWKRAQDMMERITNAVVQLPDVTDVLMQGNVGGLLIEGSRRVLSDSIDGTDNAGDFG